MKPSRIALLLASLMLTSVLVGCDGDDELSPSAACDQDFAPDGDVTYRSWNIVDPRPPGSPGYSSVYGITIRIQRGQTDGRLLLTVDSDPSALTDQGHRLFDGATCVAECDADPHAFACTVESDGDGHPQPFTATVVETGSVGGRERYGLRGTCGIDEYTATFEATAL